MCFLRVSVPQLYPIFLFPLSVLPLREQDTKLRVARDHTYLESTFDKVFPPDATQQDIFERVEGKREVDSALYISMGEARALHCLFTPPLFFLAVFVSFAYASCRKYRRRP